MPEAAPRCGARSDAGSSWRRLDRGLPQQDAHLGVLREGMAIDRYDVPGLYFGTSTGQVFASADEGESWDEIASYLPAISSVEVAVIGVAWPTCTSRTLPPLFRDLPRRVEVGGGDGGRGDRAPRRALARAPRPAVRARARAAPPHQRVRRSASAPASTRRSTRSSRVDVIAAISGG